MQHIIDAGTVLFPLDADQFQAGQFRQIFFHAGSAARELCGKRGMGRPAVVGVRGVVAQQGIHQLGAQGDRRVQNELGHNRPMNVAPWREGFHCPLLLWAGVAPEPVPLAA